MLSRARSACCYKRLNSTRMLIQRTTTETPQGHMYYIVPDVHKKTIGYCVKDVSGQGRPDRSNTTRTRRLDEYASATLDGGHGSDVFTGWIYDHLLPHAQQVKVTHPLMLRAIAHQLY